MPKDLLGALDGHARLTQECSGHVSQVVESKLRQSRAPQRTAQDMAQENIGVDRVTVVANRQNVRFRY